MNRLSGSLGLVGLTTIGIASAQITLTVTQGEEEQLAALYDANDLIQGLIATELPGDQGWYSANVDPMDRLPAFTDGEGVRFTGLTGLLSDYPGAGQPAKRIQYTLPVPADLHELRVFSGNNGRDGRVFHTYAVQFSADGGATFTAPLYVQSHPSGTLNNGQFNSWRVVLSQLTDAAGPLATEVTQLRFDFYAVDNTGGQMRDPYDGWNPFTGADDTLNAAFVSPMIWEIDVLGADSPPRLTAQVSGPGLQLTWLARADNFVVQAATQLEPPDWNDLNPQPVILREGVTNRTSLARSVGPQYFRLRAAEVPRPSESQQAYRKQPGV